ncbi:hypothetical protein MHTCC0001_07830 [Flavobacteriaceae bacterium MHTCC 0001]
MSPTTQAKLRQRNYQNYISAGQREKSKKESIIKAKETELGFHYEMKIPGYIKEDFRFYICGNNLVITTDKDSVTSVDGRANTRHNYCYPSALFKVEIPLPSLLIKNKITVEYRNEILYFSLYKSGIVNHQ